MANLSPNSSGSTAAVGESMATGSAGQQGSAGAAGGGNARRRRAGKVESHYGVRTMKYYQVTKAEIDELSTVGWLSSIFLAAGSLLAGFTWDIVLALSSGTGTNETQSSAFLRGLQWPILSAAAICLLLALGLAIFRLVRANKIKAETVFD